MENVSKFSGTWYHLFFFLFAFTSGRIEGYDGKYNKLSISGLSSPGAKVAVVLAAVAFLMISSFAGYAAYMRILKRREGIVETTILTLNQT